MNVSLCSELMNEIVTFAERVPKLANGTAWKRAEIKRCDRILTIRSVHDTGYVHDTGECIIVYNVLAVLADLRELYAMCTVVWCESFCYII